MKIKKQFLFQINRKTKYPPLCRCFPVGSFFLREINLCPRYCCLGFSVPQLLMRNKSRKGRRTLRHSPSRANYEGIWLFQTQKNWHNIVVVLFMGICYLLRSSWSGRKRVQEFLFNTRSFDFNLPLKTWFRGFISVQATLDFICVVVTLALKKSMHRTKQNAL